jgi:hypothetical protein
MEQLGNKKLPRFIPDWKSWLCAFVHSNRTRICNGIKRRHNKLRKNIVIVILQHCLLPCELLTVCGQPKTTGKCLWNCKTSGALYDKFEGFVTDLIKIGKKLTKAKQNIGWWTNW